MRGSWTFERETRIYHLVLGPCLLGEHSIIRMHGQRGKWLRVLPPLVYADEAAARRAVAKQIRRRRNRGYRRAV